MLNYCQNFKSSSHICSLCLHEGFLAIFRDLLFNIFVSGWSSFLHATAWVYKSYCMWCYLQSLWMCEWSKPYPTQVHIRYIYKCLILNGSKNHLLHPNKPTIVWRWCVVGSIGLRVFVSITWWVSSIMSLIFHKSEIICGVKQFIGKGVGGYITLI